MNNNKRPYILMLAAALAAAVSPASAAPLTGQWAAGINYPGLGLRYVTSEFTAWEARAQAESNVRVFGGRFYRYFDGGAEPVELFYGLEADYVTYKGEVSKGTGWAGEVFIGGEVFFAKNLSFQMDAGPAYVSLTDDKTDLELGGVQYVVNFGINFYWGGK